MNAHYCATVFHLALMSLGKKPESISSPHPQVNSKANEYLNLGMATNVLERKLYLKSDFMSHPANCRGVRYLLQNNAFGKPHITGSLQLTLPLDGLSYVACFQELRNETGFSFWGNKI